ncbi:glycosyltransferase [Halorientalis pallida]|uniref:Glycosyltransferase n=1 Tax=Halorientalis pallida TaxID=2479928 RepID=A0A498KYJ5_9EURY|nr:glycosyltransferase [Halorientalis pallida]RXK46948.1 glycosyltransferase [Halorientalis pallida]
MTDNLVIAHGGDVSQPSGGTNRVTAFATGLADRGFDVTLVVPEPDEELSDGLGEIETSFVSTPNSSILDEPIRASLIARRAKAIAEREDASVQLEHSTLGGIAELWGHRDYVLDMHDLAHSSSRYGDLPFGSAIQRAIYNIEKRAIDSASNIVVVSENMRTLVSETWDIDPDEIEVIPNGYATETVEPYRTDETVEGRVVFLGTLHPKLDTEAIFDIAASPEVSEMIVIGDGAKREALEIGKTERGLESLEVRGRLPDEEAFPLLARAAVAINPQTESSLQKASSPVKLFYYAALGLPMVISAGPSIGEELQQAGAAAVIEPGEAFSSQVTEVLSDKSRRDSMSEAANELAPAWGWDQRAAELSEIYGTSR